MSDITKLPHKLEFDSMGDIDGKCSVTHCADVSDGKTFPVLADVPKEIWGVTLNSSGLEAALPKWTRIAEDKSSYPTKYPVLVCWANIDGSIHIHDDFNKFEMGDWWRPLIDLDYPPKELK